MSFRWLLVFVSVVICSFLVLAAEDLGTSTVFRDTSSDSLFEEVTQDDFTDETFSRTSLGDELFQKEDELQDDGAFRDEGFDDLVDDASLDTDIPLVDSTRDDIIDEDFVIGEAGIIDTITDDASLDTDLPLADTTQADIIDEDLVIDSSGAVADTIPTDSPHDSFIERDEIQDEEFAFEDITKNDARVALPETGVVKESPLVIEESSDNKISSLRDFVEESRKPSLLKESFEAQEAEARIIEPTLKRLEFLEESGSSFIADDIRNSFKTASESVIIQKTQIPVKMSKNVEHTKISIVIRPKKVIFDFVLYEDIPKSVAEHVSELEFSNPHYIVIEEDPLIAWQFAVLDSPIELSYTVKKKIDQLPVSVVAAGLVTEDQAQYRSPSNFLRPFLIVLFGIIVLTLCGLWITHQHNSFERTYQNL